jgi:tRNA modification GTPase
VAIDFPDEDVEILHPREMHGRIESEVLAPLAALLASAERGRIFREGVSVVIVGRPNVGKSSLLNSLLREDRAIVTEIPGTTRDVLREHIQLDGMPLHVIDTAGLHESDDPVEQLGMQRARKAMESADRLLLLIDDQAGYTAADAAILDDLPAGVPHTLIFNKIDLSGRIPGPVAMENSAGFALSVQTGAGMDALRAHLKQCVGFGEQTEGDFSARRRHLDALQRVQQHLLAGQRQLEELQAGELLAEELRLAQQELGEITGEVSSDDLLGRIFSSFCIGK